MNKQFNAFTLAEVLITLTIIGVIAAITIPNLMQKYKKHQVEVGLKNAYSTLANALKLAQADTSFSVAEMVQVSNGSSTFFTRNYLIPYLKVQKQCTSNSCKVFPYNSFKVSNNSSIYAFPDTNAGFSFLLDNGMAFNVTSLFGNIRIVFDINGGNGPNLFARDIFAISLFTSANGLYFKNITGTTPIQDNNCALGGDSSWGCGWWIMKNGWKIPDNYPVKKW